MFCQSEQKTSSILKIHGNPRFPHSLIPLILNQFDPFSFFLEQLPVSTILLLYLNSLKENEFPVARARSICWCRLNPVCRHRPLSPLSFVLPAVRQQAWSEESPDTTAQQGSLVSASGLGPDKLKHQRPSHCCGSICYRSIFLWLVFHVMLLTLEAGNFACQTHSPPQQFSLFSFRPVSWSSCTNTRARCCIPTTRRRSAPSTMPCSGSCPTTSTRGCCPLLKTTGRVSPPRGWHRGPQGC